jgi:NAD(P)-dependent dehydrogenase (short-subunit alcohol dehydrogenase family)
MVKKVAEELGGLDILVNNAGIMGIPRTETEDGYEVQFGVNHLGHWTLTALLMPAILRADAARVVGVTSLAHLNGRSVNPDNPHLTDNYGEWKAYGQSKLANFHFGLGLQEQFEKAGAAASSLIAHPGLSNTNLQAKSVELTGGGFSQRFFHKMADLTGMSPATGALPQIRAATDPTAKGGQFYGPMFGTNGPPVARPILRKIGLSKAIKTLWDVSERETGIPMAL